MIKDLTEDEKLLADYMSEISERCYSAGWIENLEYALWNAVISGPRNCGHGVINQTDIDHLLNLANRVNSWILFDSEKEEIAIPLPEWKLKFENEVN